MEPMRVVIADDEPLARETLAEFLRDEPDCRLVAECAHGEEAVAALQRERPDLALLDIRMPRLDGFEVVEAVRDLPRLQVVFATAYDDYALRAFEARAVDYLLKPFDRGRFRATLERVRSLHRAGSTRETTEQLARRLNRLLEDFDGRERASDRGDGERLTVRSDGRIELLPVADIAWVDAAGNYVRLHTGDGSFTVRGTLGELEERLGGHRFQRIHRSTLVNLRKLRSLEPLPGGNYLAVLDNGQRLSVSRSFRESLLAETGVGSS